MEDEKWKNVPWEDDPLAKTPFDFLVDVLSDIPYFLQQVTSDYTLATSGPAKSQQDNILLQQQHIERLETVKVVLERWHVKYSSPLQIRPPQDPSRMISEVRSTQNTVEPPYASVLYFEDMYRAYDYIISKTTLILLMMLYECVAQDIDPSLPYPSAVLQEILPDNITIFSARYLQMYRIPLAACSWLTRLYCTDIPSLCSVLRHR